MTRYRLQILASALLFSTGGTAIKAAALGGWQVACLRSAVAAVVLFVAIPRWRRVWTWRTLLLGVFYAGTMVSFVLANKLTTAANTIVLQSTAPMYVMLLSPWVLKERIRRSDVAFTLTMAAGIVMFFLGREEPRVTAADPLLGNILGVASGITWAGVIVGMRWFGARESVSMAGGAGPAIIAGNAMAAVFCLPFAMPVPAGSVQDWGIVLYLGVFQIGLAYLLMARGTRGITALETALLMLLEPVASALWAWAIHGERPGPWSLAGSLIILSSVASRTLWQRTQRPRTPPAPRSGSGLSPEPTPN